MTQSLQPAADDAGTVQTPSCPVAAARELLARTAELPGGKRELLAVLTEYRAALFDLAVERDKHCGQRQAQ